MARVMGHNSIQTERGGSGSKHGHCREGSWEEEGRDGLADGRAMHTAPRREGVMAGACCEQQDGQDQLPPIARADDEVGKGHGRQGGGSFDDLID